MGSDNGSAIAFGFDTVAVTAGGGTDALSSGTIGDISGTAAGTATATTTGTTAGSVVGTATGIHSIKANAIGFTNTVGAIAGTGTAIASTNGTGATATATGTGIDPSFVNALGNPIAIKPYGNSILDPSTIGGAAGTISGIGSATATTDGVVGGLATAKGSGISDTTFNANGDISNLALNGITGTFTGVATGASASSTGYGINNIIVTSANTVTGANGTVGAITGRATVTANATGTTGTNGTAFALGGGIDILAVAAGSGIGAGATGNVGDILGTASVTASATGTNAKNTATAVGGGVVDTAVISGANGIGNIGTVTGTVGTLSATSAAIDSTGLTNTDGAGSDAYISGGGIVGLTLTAGSVTGDGYGVIGDITGSVGSLGTHASATASAGSAFAQVGGIVGGATGVITSGVTVVAGSAGSTSATASTIGNITGTVFADATAGGTGIGAAGTAAVGGTGLSDYDGNNANAFSVTVFTGKSSTGVAKIGDIVGSATGIASAVNGVASASDMEGIYNQSKGVTFTGIGNAVGGSISIANTGAGDTTGITGNAYAKATGLTSSTATALGLDGVLVNADAAGLNGTIGVINASVTALATSTTVVNSNGGGGSGLTTTAHAYDFADSNVASSFNAGTASGAVVSVGSIGNITLASTATATAVGDSAEAYAWVNDNGGENFTVSGGTKVGSSGTIGNVTAGTVAPLAAVATSAGGSAEAEAYGPYTMTFDAANLGIKGQIGTISSVATANAHATGNDLGDVATATGYGLDILTILAGNGAVTNASGTVGALTGVVTVTAQSDGNNVGQTEATGYGLHDLGTNGSTIAIGNGNPLDGTTTGTLGNGIGLDALVGTANVTAIAGGTKAGVDNAYALGRGIGGSTVLSVGEYGTGTVDNITGSMPVLVATANAGNAKVDGRGIRGLDIYAGDNRYTPDAGVNWYGSVGHIGDITGTVGTALAPATATTTSGTSNSSVVDGVYSNRFYAGSAAGSGPLGSGTGSLGTIGNITGEAYVTSSGATNVQAYAHGVQNNTIKVANNGLNGTVGNIVGKATAIVTSTAGVADVNTSTAYTEAIANNLIFIATNGGGTAVTTGKIGDITGTAISTTNATGDHAVAEGYGTYNDVVKVSSGGGVAVSGIIGTVTGTATVNATGNSAYAEGYGLWADRYAAGRDGSTGGSSGTIGLITGSATVNATATGTGNVVGPVNYEADAYGWGIDSVDVYAASDSTGAVGTVGTIVAGKLEGFNGSANVTATAAGAYAGDAAYAQGRGISSEYNVYVGTDGTGTIGNITGTVDTLTAQTNAGNASVNGRGIRGFYAYVGDGVAAGIGTIGNITGTVGATTAASAVSTSTGSENVDVYGLRSSTFGVGGSGALAQGTIGNVTGTARGNADNNDTAYGIYNVSLDATTGGIGTSGTIGQITGTANSELGALSETAYGISVLTVQAQTSITGVWGIAAGAQPPFGTATAIDNSTFDVGAGNIGAIVADTTGLLAINSSQFTAFTNIGSITTHATGGLVGGTTEGDVLASRFIAGWSTANGGMQNNGVAVVTIGNVNVAGSFIASDILSGVVTVGNALHGGNIGDANTTNGGSIGTVHIGLPNPMLDTRTDGNTWHHGIEANSIGNGAANDVIWGNYNSGAIGTAGYNVGFDANNSGTATHWSPNDVVVRTL